MNDPIVARLMGKLVDDLAVPVQENEGVIVRFYYEAVQDQEKSLEAGHPVHVDCEFIEKRIPGDVTQIVQRQVREEDKLAFPTAWKHFKSGQGDTVIGMRLGLWPSITRAQCKDLEYFGIKTVEQLASVSDGNVANMGPYQELRRKAQSWIAATAGNAPIVQAHAENEALRNELETLKKALKEQGDRLEAVTKKGAK